MGSVGWWKENFYPDYPDYILLENTFIANDCLSSSQDKLIWVWFFIFSSTRKVERGDESTRSLFRRQDLDRLKTTCSALQVGLGGNSLGVILDESLSIINNQYMGGMVPCFLTSDNVRWDINWYPTGRCRRICECPQILTDSVCFLNLL